MSGRAASREPIWRLVAGLSALACVGALVRTSASGVFVWSVALIALGLAARSALSVRPAGLLRRPSLPWLAALVPIGVNLASVVAFELPARAASWWPLLVLPLVASLPGSTGEGVRLLERLAILSCWAALAIALVAVRLADPARIGVTVNPILFGQVAVAMALVCAVSLSGVEPGVDRRLLFASMIAGLVAAIVAGYRGGLLALPLFALCAVRGLRTGSAGARAWFALAIVVLAAGVAVFFSPMFDRIALAVDEALAYADGAIGFSSVGTRFALWQLAADLFFSRPLFGIGADRFGEAMTALAAAGRLPADLAVFDHAHNTALNLAAEYGIVGLVALLLAVLAVWCHAARLEPRARRMVRYGLACWILFSLTNDVLAHQSSMRIMCLTLGLAMAGAVRARREPARRLAATDFRN